MEIVCTRINKHRVQGDIMYPCRAAYIVIGRIAPYIVVINDGKSGTKGIDSSTIYGGRVASNNVIADGMFPNISRLRII